MSSILRTNVPLDVPFHYRIEHDERFLRRIAKAREEIRKGEYVTLDELSD